MATPTAKTLKLNVKTGHNRQNKQKDEQDIHANPKDDSFKLKYRT